MVHAGDERANGGIVVTGARQEADMECIGVEDAFDLGPFLRMAVHEAEEGIAIMVGELINGVFQLRVFLTSRSIAMERNSLGIDK